MSNFTFGAIFFASAIVTLLILLLAFALGGYDRPS